MDALVAQIAIAVIPEPVPVVMKSVAGELVQRRRAEPEVVVHARGHRLDRLAADGVAPLEAQPARHIDLADNALAQLLGGLARDARAAIGAVLHQAVVLLSRGDDLPRLEHVVRARFLYVN